jgi:hypothetical protein
MPMDNNNLLNGDDLMDYAMGGVPDEVASTQPDGSSQDQTNPATEDRSEPEQTEFDFGEQRQPVVEERPRQEVPTQVGDNKAVDPKGLKPLGNNLTDAAGNIYDQRGTLLAKAGAERRMFERMSSVQEAMQHKDSYIAQLEREVKTFKEQPPRESALDQAVKQLKFSEPEVVNGLRFTNLWKTNPLNAVAHVLAEARKLGYNDQQISQAVQSYNPATDPAMIQSVVNEAIRPVVDRIEGMNRTNPPQGEDGLRQEITRVFAKYPGTHLHQDALASMMRDSPNLQLEDAVRGLIAFAQKHGLDYTQPLRPQVEARQARQNRPAQPNMPGRVPTETPQVFRASNQTAFASPDASYAEIVADVMKSQNRRA